MKLEVINGQRVLTPESGFLLCNETDKAISDKVYLGINADKTMWSEIAEKEKETLETTWESEVDTVDNSEYAEVGKILMGVSE